MQAPILSFLSLFASIYIIRTFGFLDAGQIARPQSSLNQGASARQHPVAAPAHRPVKDQVRVGAAVLRGAAGLRVAQVMQPGAPGNGITHPTIAPVQQKGGPAAHTTPTKKTTKATKPSSTVTTTSTTTSTKTHAPTRPSSTTSASTFTTKKIPTISSELPRPPTAFATFTTGTTVTLLPTSSVVSFPMSVTPRPSTSTGSTGSPKPTVSQGPPCTENCHLGYYAACVANQACPSPCCTPGMICSYLGQGQSRCFPPIY